MVVMNVYSVLCDSSIKVVVVLQSCMGLLKVEPGSDSETCHDENQVTDIKVEEAVNVQEEDDPVTRTFSVTKTEHGVSVYVYIVVLLATESVRELGAKENA
jgi:hypothetical protein